MWSRITSKSTWKCNVYKRFNTSYVNYNTWNDKRRTRIRRNRFRKNKKIYASIQLPSIFSWRSKNITWTWKTWNWTWSISWKSISSGITISRRISLCNKSCIWNIIIKWFYITRKYMCKYIIINGCGCSNKKTSCRNFNRFNNRPRKSR